MGQYEDMMNEMSELADSNFNFEPSTFEPQNADSKQGGISAVRGLASQSQGVKNPNTNNLANFNIQVTRPTRAIVGVSLPFVLFGYQEEVNLYKSLINSILPAGVTFTSYTTNGINSTFTYTQGANVDTIVVSCKEYPYVPLVYASSVNRFEVAYMRYRLSVTTQIAQYDEAFTFVKRNMFGITETNPINIGSYQKPEDYNTGIVNVPVAYNVGKAKSITHSIIDSGAANFSITISMFVSKVVTQD
jgi:hypothetical protein